jgi:membrane glycosyltransferase
MGRVHLVMGACSYIVSAVWAASLLVGVVLALQGQQVIPSYFQDSKTLFPIWPVIDPGAAFRLFLATMVVVMLPKLLGLVLEAKRAIAAREPGGPARVTVGVLAETVFSMLFAPILMITHSAAIAQVVLGRDSGWKAQRRDDGSLPFSDALRFHWRHTLIGAALAAICWLAAPSLVAWMSPVILGLVLSAPLTWLTARPAGRFLGMVLSTPEDRSPPPVLVRAERQAVEWSHRISAVARAKPEAVVAGAPPKVV